MLQKTFRADYLQTVRLWRERTVPGGRKRARRVDNKRLRCGSESVVFPHLASSHRLAHRSVDAQRKTFRWRMRSAFLIKSPFFSCQSPTSEEFQRKEVEDSQTTAVYWVAPMRQTQSRLGNLFQQTGTSPLARHIEKVSVDCGF
ncbi:unnamed protein product [Pleuronectes platessa]|uniref:Uncharacterized protein n=1 Tax=Pleuronectes platessa TaxID=8262 RepID=A0A9N7ZCK3_PLEPL|nr:unnamed protein product [Pleuronectes platessa]